MFDRVATFSDPALRQYMVGSMQSRLNQLVNEVSSGRKANPAADMGTSASLLYQMQMKSAQQSGLKTSITLASQRMETVQTALSSVASVALPIFNTVQSWTSAMSQGMDVVAEQARGVTAHVVSLLNTSFVGAAVFGGADGGTTPMQAPEGTAGMFAVAKDVLADKVAANGGPLSADDIDGLLNGTDGVSSIFDDTNSDPARRYAGAVYTGATDNVPTKVLIGTNQTAQYDSSANQPAFRSLMKGLAMLSLLDSPAGNLTDQGRSELLRQAGSVLGQAQNQLTVLQGRLGTAQARLAEAADTQQAAADATDAQILTYVQADTYGNATKISALQTQLQATYTLTSQISQLSLVHYMP